MTANNATTFPSASRPEGFAELPSPPGGLTPGIKLSDVDSSLDMSCSVDYASAPTGAQSNLFGANDWTRTLTSGRLEPLRPPGRTSRPVCPLPRWAVLAGPTVQQDCCGFSSRVFLVSFFFFQKLFYRSFELHPSRNPIREAKFASEGQERTARNGCATRARRFKVQS